MEKSDLLNKWKKLKATQATKTPAVHPISKRESSAANAPVPATSGQRRLWLLQQMYPDNLFYQYAHRYEFKGILDPDRLADALRRLQQRQDILRAYFQVEAGEVMLTFAPLPEKRLSLVDLSELPESEAAIVAKATEETFTRQPFDLGKPPLFRCQLIKLSTDQYTLLLSIHHAIGDRSSLLVLQEELFRLYANAGNTEIDLPALPIQFADYAAWIDQQTIPPAHIAYWKEQLAGEIPHTELPYDHPRPAKPSFRGGVVKRNLPALIADRLKSFSIERATTINVCLLAVLKTLLFRYAGNREDIIVGSPVSIRDRTELENLVGFLNETVVLRSFPQAEQSFTAFVDTVRQTMENAITRADVPFDELVKAMNTPRRTDGSTPFFEVMFVYNSASRPPHLTDELQLVKEDVIDLQTAKFDLTLFATSTNQGLELSFEFSKDRFEEDTVIDLLDRYMVLLDAALQQPEAKIGDLSLLTTKDQKMVLSSWSQTVSPTQAPSSVLDRIIQASKERPTAIAVIAGDERLNYHELLTRADRLAQQLLRAGIKGDGSSIIGLYAKRQPAAIVGMLGILRAGAAYLPLAPEYPKERIDYMLEDSGVEHIVIDDVNTSKQLIAPGSAYKLHPIGEAAVDPGDSTVSFPVIHAQNRAYIIYTSGSTGRPKGVPVSHANLAWSTAARDTFFTSSPQVFLLLSAFSFDSSIAGIYWTLCTGGALVISPSRAEQDMQGLTQMIAHHKVTHTLLLPSLYNILLEYADPSKLASLQTVMVAGEACPSNLIKRHFALLTTTSLVNEYGPTEATVWSTAHKIKPTDAAGRVPIGRPIPFVQNYVLDERMQAVPAGVMGELYLGGPTLVSGYLQRPALTENRFVEWKPLPEKEAIRLYRTGDRVSWRKDGLLDFHGRVDRQIKIRGHRVEPDEVARRINELPEVREAVVRVLQQAADEGPVLIAYYQGRNNEVGETVIRDQLVAQLPDYLVPAHCIAVTDFPRLPNGKIDYQALPAPETTTHTREASRVFAAPISETEQQIAGIWEKVLKYTPVGRNDNFFDLGGDSLKSIRVLAEADRLGLSLAVHQLFAYQTVAELAAALTTPKPSPDELMIGSAGVAPEDEANYQAVIPLKTSGNRPPLFCLHSGGGHVFFYQPLSKYLNADRPLYTIQPRGLDGATDLPTSIEEMAADYIEAMQEVQPTGPYCILGTCFSNALSLEIAHQLKNQKESLEVMIIVDSGPPTVKAPVDEQTQNQPVRNLFRLLRKGKWKNIKAAIYRRWYWGKRDLIATTNTQKRNTFATIKSLNQLYAKYQPKAYNGRIHFIRSTEFSDRADKDWHLAHWSELAAAGLETYVVPGHHQTLFGEPEVQGLAEKINTCLE